KHTQQKAPRRRFQRRVSFGIAPNMDLEAETSDSFEIGNKFDNGRAQLYVSAFYNKFQNFIDVVTTGQDNFGNY
ncbi:TonB-dependent receptor, partial [Vibrio parahaemolyticus]|uniref:TonB-dependent receptor domain-containing protein n=1 Tax=Vibrio parahaemolyticus TaxID=670 RepID=UPI001C916794